MTHGYRLDSGRVLDLHPDGLRIAVGVFETFADLSSVIAPGGPVPVEEAMAHAIVAYNTFVQRYEAEEKRRGNPAQDLDRWTPEGRERL